MNWAGTGTQPGYLASIATGGTTTSSYTWDGTGAPPGQLSSALTGSTTTN